MSRARRLAGLPPPKDDLIIRSNDKSSSSLKLIQPIKRIIVPKNIKSSRKSSSIDSRIPLTSKVLPLIKNDEKVEKVSKSNSYKSTRREQEMEQKGDNDNSLNIDGLNEKSKVTLRNPIFQVPITPANVEVTLPKIHKHFEQPENPNLLKIVVLGTPNAGKSTLLNALLGETVSTVSHKAHTTRERIPTVLTEGNKQLIFIDTPGIVPGRNRLKLNRGLINASWHSLNEADHVLVIIDAFRALYRTTYAESLLFNRLKEYKLPGTLVLNKTDLLANSKKSIPSIYKKFTVQYPYFKHKTSISALKRIGITELKNTLFSNTYPHDWIYPPGQKIDMPDSKRVEDFIRAEIYERLRDNLPYVVRQENVGWTNLPNNVLRIDQNIYVDNPSQMKILIGANGTIIKTIGVRAATKLSAVFNKTVRLYLTVKTKSLEKIRISY
ncbi:P-loop containing nucleoside triphosphate hydrolase protein [Glomus cerebriforme]|uniref:P-loop containing nucleoside triphosphate hydrolase protein n=1 Tax=Glomus cerebriforme TaxID=658196 RepID=A0A397TKQ2_9GLOM|nr:P-loop containing nucleoside triphosphate hydrolase protein [Glomus cerebriforme]